MFRQLIIESAGSVAIQARQRVLPRIWTFGFPVAATFAATKELLAHNKKDANDGWYCENKWHKKKDQYDDTPQHCIAAFLLRCFSVEKGVSRDWFRCYPYFRALVALICVETLPAVLTVHESFTVYRFSRIDISRSAVRATQSELVEPI
ncbi:MAG: hypothetical protein KAU89_07385 [Candidatus Thorarchaeota archaeon]|nr:hypothetical protein [Candidatus Thorarchaeota archaeon]